MSDEELSFQLKQEVSAFLKALRVHLHIVQRSEDVNVSSSQQQMQSNQILSESPFTLNRVGSV